MKNESNAPRSSETGLKRQRRRLLCRCGARHERHEAVCVRRGTGVSPERTETKTGRSEADAPWPGPVEKSQVLNGPELGLELVDILPGLDHFPIAASPHRHRFPPMVKVISNQSLRPSGRAAR